MVDLDYRETDNKSRTLFFIGLWQQKHCVQNLNSSISINVNTGFLGVSVSHNMGY